MSPVLMAIKPPSRPKPPAPPPKSQTVAMPAAPETWPGWLVFWLSLAAVGLLAFLLAHVEIFSPDIGFHLNHGRWIVEHGRVPTQHPYLQGEFAYVDLSWLYQVVSAWLHGLYGPSSLVLANLGLALACFCLLVAHSRRREGRWSTWLAPVLALGVLGSHWEIRPHTLSWVFLGAMLLLLEQYRTKPNRSLWLLPLILLLWVNCHSLYALGLVVLGAYSLDVGLDPARRGDRRFWYIVAASVGACLLNPYGLDGLVYPLKQLGMLQAGTVFKSADHGIAEFQSPFRRGVYSAVSGQFVLLQPVLFMHLYLCLAVSVVLLMLKRLTRIEALLLVLFGYIAVTAEKNFGYFFVATFPLVVNRLRLLGLALAARWKKLPPARLRTAFAAATLFGLLLSASQVANGWYHAQQRIPMRAGTGFNADFLPVGAAKFIARSDIPDGILLNTIDAGGFLALQTGRKVFIDGLLETFGPYYYREYNELKDLKNLPYALREKKFEIAVVPCSAVPQWLYFFDRQAKWRLVHADARDAVFFAPAFAPHIPAIESPSAGRDFKSYSDDEEERIVRAHLALPDGWTPAALLSHHHYPTREIRLSAFHSMRGQPQASLSFTLTGMEKATALNTDLLLNAGHAFFDTKQPKLAALCYRAFLEHDRAPKTRDDPVLRIVHARLEKLPVEE